MTRSCPDCGREWTPPAIPANASYELEQAFRATARICLFCHDTNLLAGGWSDGKLEERWSADDLIEMGRKAQSLRQDRLLDQWQRRSARRAKQEKAQAALV